jgi:integrase
VPPGVVSESGPSGEVGRPGLLVTSHPSLSRVKTVPAERHDLAAEHMASAKRELETRTFNGYRDVWAAHVDSRILGREDRQWHHSIADTSLRMLTPSVIEAWRNERLEAGAGATSIRKVMVVMLSMLEHAKRDRKVTFNAAREVRKPSGKRKGSVSVVPPDKIEQIRAKLDAEGKALVSVLAYAGVRPGEALSLRCLTLASKPCESSKAPTRTARLRKRRPARTVASCCSLPSPPI